MNEGVKCENARGATKDFPITIGLHQVSNFKPLSSYLSLGCIYGAHSRAKTVMYIFLADDTVLLGEMLEEINKRLETW